MVASIDERPAGLFSRPSRPKARRQHRARSASPTSDCREIQSLTRPPPAHSWSNYSVYRRRPRAQRKAKEAEGEAAIDDEPHTQVPLSPLTSHSHSETHQRPSKRARTSKDEPHIGSIQPPDTPSAAVIQDHRGGHTDTVSPKLPQESSSVEESVQAIQEPADPIAYYAKHRTWPKNFANLPPMSSSGAAGKRQKRSNSQSSYSERRRDGEVPKPYKKGYDGYLAENGLNMDLVDGEELLSSASKRMCTDLHNPVRQAIEPSIFPASAGIYRRIIKRYQNRNEAIVQRDITPMLLPPLISLEFVGDHSAEFLSDEVNAPWYNQCQLAGPRPQPDLAIGLSKSAFTKAELDKLDRYKSAANWTRVTDHMYFPFLMCEVKCGVEALTHADRQNMHSCSVAVRAILRLIQEADKYRADQEAPGLSGQALVFSISHDQADVRIHAHFGVYDDAKKDWTYHRYLVRTRNFFESENILLEVHSFVRNVLQTYAPTLLDRLSRAISGLPKPKELPPDAAAPSLSEESQGSQAQQQSGETDEAGDGVFRKPDLPLTARLQTEMGEMRQQLRHKDEQMEKLLQLMEKQREDSQMQLAQQSVDSKMQLEQQRKDSQMQIEQLRNDNRQQMDRILQQLERQGRQ